MDYITNRSELEALIQLWLVHLRSGINIFPNVVYYQSDTADVVCLVESQNSEICVMLYLDYNHENANTISYIIMQIGM